MAIDVKTCVVYRVFFHADRKGFENVKGNRKNDEQAPILKNDDIGVNAESSEDLEEDDAQRYLDFKARPKSSIPYKKAMPLVVFNSFDYYHEVDGCEVKTEQNLLENINRSVCIFIFIRRCYVIMHRPQSSTLKVTLFLDDLNDQGNDVLYSDNPRSPWDLLLCEPGLTLRLDRNDGGV
ncbi:hypothetical protein AgCh_021946 [Apium graveolens]